MDITITGPPGSGQIVAGWQLHAGDRIAVPDAGKGTIAAVVTEIRSAPALTRDERDLDWEAVDHHCTGHLHYSPCDLVNRLYQNGAAA